MNLYFITHRISTPFTGGEKCNAAMLIGARQAGLHVDCWEGDRYGRLKKNVMVMNCIYFFKALFSKPRSLLVLDMDFHARYIVAMLWMKYVLRDRVVAVLYHYNYWDKETRISRNVHYLLEAFVSRYCDRLITISRFSMNNFKALAKKDAECFINMPYVRENAEAVEPARFDPSTVRLLFVGSIEPRKNVVNTIKSLAAASSPVRLDLVGVCFSKAYGDAVAKLIETSGTAHSTALLGRLDEKALKARYAASTVFILVSVMEGYGMVYGEAMRYGLPIIGTTRGAVPELVEDGINGFLCDPDDIGGIAAAIGKLNNREVWERISRANLRKYESLADRDQFIRRSTEIFQRISSL